MAPAALMTLAVELRLNIWTQLFHSTVLCYGEALAKQAHPLAILETCKQIRQEAQDCLCASITLHFASTNLMLQTLLPMSADERSRFRHVRVKGYPLPMYASVEAGYYITHTFAAALAMLPGLQLDTLVVEDVYHDEDDGWGDGGTYNEVEALIYCSGWRRLLYYSPTSAYLTRGDADYLNNVTQPDMWRAQLAAFADAPDHSKFPARAKPTEPLEALQQGGSVALFLASSTDVALQTGEGCGSLVDTVEASPTWQRVRRMPLQAQAEGHGSPVVDKLDAAAAIAVVAKRGRDWPTCKQTGNRVPEVLLHILEAHSGDWIKIRDESGCYIDAEDDPNGHL